MRPVQPTRPRALGGSQLPRRLDRKSKFLLCGLDTRAALKASLGTTVAIIALSLAVWVFFYVVSPGEPLTPGETSVVVGVCAVIVLSAKWIWARLHKAKEGK